MQELNISRAWYKRIEKRGFQSLAQAYPQIAAQWHPSKNNNWTPSDFAYGSGAKVWWKCERGSDHEWQSTINARTRMKRVWCPFCNGMQLSVTNTLCALFPELAQQWHPIMNNDLKPKDVRADSKERVWWVCSRDANHVWKATIRLRTAGKSRCPFCPKWRVSRTNNLKILFPEVAAQWHPTKNGNLKPRDIAPFSHIRVWWKCPKGPDHEWLATPRGRTFSGSGCHACAGKKASMTNSLESLFPEIAKEWNKEKNGALRPCDVTAGTSRKVWWQCSFGHSWEQTIASRTRQIIGCGTCRKKKKRPRHKKRQVLSYKSTRRQSLTINTRVRL